MTNIFQAIVFGVIQGITEFLPVSSTGHIRLTYRLFNWQDAGPTFDVALHAGTLIAVILYFWRDWIDVLRPVVNTALGKEHAASPHFGRNLFWGIVLGCVPAAVFGFLLDDQIEAFETNPAMNTTVMIVVAVSLIVVGIVLWFADRNYGKHKTRLAQMNVGDWITIGLAQAVALIPGVSRSGATISAGLFRGMNRDAAARFSFLLTTPVFLGAVAFKLKSLAETGIPQAEVAPFIVGMVTSAIVGCLAIRFMLSYVRKHSMNVFVWYRIILGVVILVSLAVIK